MKRPHHQLRVWNEALELAAQVYAYTAGLPEQERFGLQSQMRRAAVSVPSNIAEGAARGTTPDYLRMLRIARGSLAELETQLRLCQQLHGLDCPEQLPESLDSVFLKLNSLIKTLQEKSK